MFGEIGFDKLLLLLVMFLLLFGAKRLPEIGRSLGKGIREFKGSLSGLGDTLELNAGDATPRQVASLPLTGTSVDATTVEMPAVRRLGS